MNTAATIPIRHNSKAALVPWEQFQRRVPTEAERTVWTKKYPKANRGLVTGAISGVIVLDVDPKRHGQQALQGRALPPTRTVQTPSGGWHYYFAHPGHPVPCVPDLLPGVDLKGDAGYVLVPPSSIDGRAYALVVDEPPAPMPDWLREAIAAHQAPRNGQARMTESEITTLLRGVPEGQRDKTAVRLAGHLLAKRLPTNEVLELLRTWNMRNTPPLDDAALRKCVVSIDRAEQRKHAPAVLPALVPMHTVTPEAVTWLWKPYLPRGKVIGVSGDPEAGKTFLMLATATHLSRGVPLPGEKSLRPAERTLYLTAEDGIADTLATRLHTMDADLQQIVCLAGRVVAGVREDGAISLSKDLALLRAAVLDVRPALVVFDPIQGFLGSEVDMHRTNQVRPVLTSLQRLAEEFDFTAVLVGHLTKGARDRALYRVMGSIDFAAHARSVLLIARDPNTPHQRVLIHEKSSLGPKGPALTFEIRADGAFAWIGESTLTAEEILQPMNGDDQRKREDARTFLRELLADGPVPSKDLMREAAHNGLSQATMFRAKSDLGIRARKRGLQGGWEWFLGPADHSRETGEESLRR